MLRSLSCFLGELLPEDVVVEAYCGRLGPNNQYIDRFTVLMALSDADENQVHQYHSDVRFDEAGRYGVNIRITPNHLNNQGRHAMGLVIWGEI